MIVALLLAALGGEPSSSEPARVTATGRLTASGGGVAGVTLQFVEPSGSRTFEATTGADGRYEVSLPTPGFWGILVLSGKRLPTATFSRGLREGTQTADLALPGDGSLEVRVTRDDGRSLAGEEIQVVLGDARGDRITGPLEPGEESSFRFFGLPPGTYTVNAKTSPSELVSDGGAVAELTKASGTASVEVRLRPSGELLRLSGPRGTPVSGAVVHANGKRLAERDGSVGVFSLARVPAGAEIQVVAPLHVPTCRVLGKDDLPLATIELAAGTRTATIPLREVPADPATPLGALDGLPGATCPVVLYRRLFAVDGGAVVVPSLPEGRFTFRDAAGAPPVTVSTRPD